MRRSTVTTRLVAAFVGLLAMAGPVRAHAGGLSGVVDPGPVPLWLVVVTGGVVVGASFLFSTFLTDHAGMKAVTRWRLELPIAGGTRKWATWTLRALSLIGLVLVVASGFLGPHDPFDNAAILVVWAAWWAGFTMVVYLFGDLWPVVNPWAGLTAVLGTRPRFSYPDRLGAWPAVIGLIGLVWLEVVSPVAEDPRLLVTVILGYTVVTVIGVVALGSGVWFGRVDPIARVFRVYGALAPVQRTESGIAIKLPSAALVRETVETEAGGTAFVIALLWVTTFDGLVATPAWRTVIAPIVEVGVPARLVYFVAILAGFILFLGAYRYAARWSRETADTYVTTEYIRRWFGPSLVPIAAGYHLAHFLGYFLSLAPVIAAVVLNPLSTPVVEPLTLPGWFASTQLLLVLGGHLVAVWVAHARSFDLFPGVLSPIRSQYPFIAVMVFYTMSSMWVVAQPFVQPPYV